MSSDDIAAKVADRYPSHFLRSYVRTKIRTDPVYLAALKNLREARNPILDLGCGAGVLAFFLREHGLTVAIEGIDHDRRKIDVAERMVRPGEHLQFREGDIRELPRFSGSVVMLDVLHYFTQQEQGVILRKVAESVAPGGVAILRDAIRDESWRFRVTWLAEAFARATRWLRAERLEFPTLESIRKMFPEDQFTATVTPLWGGTPFNNYLLVFKRSSAGMTNE
ncbi:MAG: class I SAM-dependent methyltransferase [Thermoanaerobaculia bacterium]